ncbi:MAG TPA: HU family DNA-binding protein [Longimicrobiaceae bacterium]|nr:HU family DNA-binding protein [Longimicrobiaceae bacterium]
MNKSEFIDKVAEKAELTRAAAARVVDAIFDTASGAISEAVHAAGSLSIPGFGKFTRRTRAARTGRNPRTGASIKIPERTSIGFSAGKGLKEQRSTSRRKTTTGAKAGAASTRAGTARSGAAKSGGTKSTGAKPAGAAKKPAAKPAAKPAGAAKKPAAKPAGGARSGRKNS